MVRTIWRINININQALSMHCNQHTEPLFEGGCLSWPSAKGPRMGALQFGPWPTRPAQKFAWYVGHNAFGTINNCNNWPVCMYVNSSCCQLILKKISKNWNHQMSDFKAKMHQIRFPPGLRPRLRWGSLQRSPEPLAVFKKFMSKGREKRGGERENIQKTSLLTAIILRYL